MAANETRTGITAAVRNPMGPPPVPSAGGFQVHQHTEVELMVYAHGHGTMFFGGQTLKIVPGRLVLFWGAMPHYALQAEASAVAYVVRIPLAAVLQWNLPAWLVQKVVNFQVLLDVPRRVPCPDLELLRHWVALVGKRTLEAERVVLLEVEARLRRMAMEQEASAALAERIVGAGRLEKMVEIIARRCLGCLRIPDVAHEAGLTRAYAMRLFRKSMGMTMLEYISRQRISHAQRLLATTDRSVIDVMGACGYVSPARFYALFHRFVGCRPGDYRRKLRPVAPR